MCFPRIIASLLLLTSATLPAQPAVPPSSAPAEASPTTGPSAPSWRLSASVYPEGVGDESQYLKHVRRQRDRLGSLAAEAADPALAVEYNLAAANLILAQEIEPFASRRLLELGLPDDESAVDSLLAAAQAKLEAAAAALERWQDGADPDRERWSGVLETLQAFSAALQALWQRNDEGAYQTRREGAAELAVLLEDDRAPVASAALLWQAVLYRRIGRPDKAFDLLPIATERVPPDAGTYPYFARLLRCRLVADRAGYATACSLLLQLEERVGDWFPDQDTRDEGRHTAMLMRAQVLEAWRRSLDGEGQTEEAAWCTQALEGIYGPLVAQGAEVSLLRLGNSIPMIMPVPDVTDAGPTTAPAAEAPAVESWTGSESDDILDVSLRRGGGFRPGVAPDAALPVVTGFGDFCRSSFRGGDVNIAHRPIAVFDSGLGGLTVVRALQRRLPAETVVYFGDTARVPYGPKSVEAVTRFTREIVHFLLRFEPKCIVVACSTASAVALPEVAGEFDVPMIGTVAPGAAAAVRASEGRLVAILATEATIASNQFRDAINRLNPRIPVVQKACPLFVPLVEEGREEGNELIRLAVAEYLEPVRRLHPAVAVLGCTHYPMLRGAIAEFLGDAVTLIDTSEAVSAAVHALLERCAALSASDGRGRLFCYVSDNVQRFQSIGSRFLGRTVTDVVRTCPEEFAPAEPAVMVGSRPRVDHGRGAGRAAAGRLQQVAHAVQAPAADE